MLYGDSFIPSVILVIVRSVTAAVLKEPWEDKEARIKEASPYGHVSNWNILFCEYYSKKVEKTKEIGYYLFW